MAKKILSDKDSALFRQTVGKVTIIKDDKVLLKPKVRVRAKDNREETFQRTAIVDEPLRAEDSLNFLTTGLPKNLLKKLRQGYFGLDAKLDLHGLNSYQAQRKLHRFLDDSVEEGCQCVHIIHGKGYGSKNNYPILKNNLNSWLKQHRDVQAFCSALPKNGGTGAVWVLLHLADKYQS